MEYWDLDNEFTQDQRTYTDAIDQGIRNLLLTSQLERLFRPDFFANLGDALFELDNEATAWAVEVEIYTALDQEERIKVLNVEVVPETDHVMSIRIDYEIPGMATPYTYEMKLEK